MPGSNTPFEPLWVDTPDALDELQRRRDAGAVTAEVAERLAHLIEYGWVVIPGAISTAHADRLAQEIDDVVDTPEYFLARRNREAYSQPRREIYSDPSFRLIDYHVNSSIAREAIFSPGITAVLRAAFEADLNAFQCLTFHYGSQQALHQDGAYVVVSKPLQFMASWLALEDVTPGSGELTYYSGSHHLDDHLFGGNSKCWEPKVHGKEAHINYLRELVERSEAASLSLDTFMAKKGDALIWASDLIHGGSKITNDGTRRSLVTHYCPYTVDPKFSTFTHYYHRERVAPGCYITSRHYDLRPGPLRRLLGPLAAPPRYRRPAFTGK